MTSWQQLVGVVVLNSSVEWRGWGWGGHNLSYLLSGDDSQLCTFFSFQSFTPHLWSHGLCTTVYSACWCLDDGQQAEVKWQQTELMVLIAPRLKIRVNIPDLHIGEFFITANPRVRNLRNQAATIDEHRQKAAAQLYETCPHWRPVSTLHCQVVEALAKI